MSHSDSTPTSAGRHSLPQPPIESSTSDPTLQPRHAYASTSIPSASSYGPSQLRVEPESPFVSEPRTDSPDETEDSAAATPLAESVSVRFPRSVQPPERQGTARPRDYPSRQRTLNDDELAHDQKLADMGSIRMGTSALISALSALPLEGDETSSDEAGDERRKRNMAQSMGLPPQRPRLPHMQSSLRTLRPMVATTPIDEDEAYASPRSARSGRSVSPEHSDSHSPRRRRRRLSFPYKENVISRRARAPSDAELSYQLAPKTPDEKEKPHLPRPASSSTLKQHEAETSDESRDVVDIETSPLGVPQHGHFAVEGPEYAPQMLQRVFGLEEQEELIEEMHCWLLRSDMLQGYMYLTRRHICFYANVTPSTNVTIKSGPLWKKASRTKLSNRYWVTLKNDVLSWFEHANDPYFPRGNVSLQYASSCELVDDTRFKIRLPERNYTFQSETPANAQEWVRVIQKAIVKTQHEGQGVKLIIPWEAVYEVERSPTLEFQETIEVKVIDSEDAMSLDSYFFASFPDNDYAYELLQTLLKERPVSELPQVAAPSAEPASEAPRKRPDSLSRFSFTGLSSALPIPKFGGDRSEGEARVPIAPPALLDLPDSSVVSVASQSQSEADSEMSEDDEATRRRKGYPPKLSGQPPPGMMPPPSGWGPTDWIRRGSAQLFGTSPGSDYRPPPPPPRRRPRKQSSVTEVVEGAAYMTTDDDASEPDLPHHVAPTRPRPPAPKSSLSLTTQIGVQEDSIAKKFRQTFSLPDHEVLIDHMSGSLYRMLPVSGRFFVSTNYFCFRSSGILHSKTKMIVPIRELYGMKAQKAFRFGHHALIVIIKGHEELFLEFHSARRRDELMTLLEERMDDLRDESQVTKAVEESLPAGRPITDEMAGDSEPTGQGLMFSSTTSSFLQFKPEPMTIVCLTIGSRGDVQPYIALCMGLQAEGHTCRIASHAEYKDWVEGHGIGFAPVGGDPAKLMELCVDNGMFTIAFLKEGLQMFRGWLDDLLNDSWTACQGADLLIESPSAMAGIHIAEALRIPYYRAFTMPWTRTRAYPQAFAVPEHKRGGSYNYMTYVMFDNVFWRAISGQVNRWRKNVLGIDSTTFDKMQQDKVPFLYNFSPTVVPPPLDWTEWIHVSGYWFLENGNKDWQPPPGIVEFIDNAHAAGKKVVYIGFGSIVVSDPHEMTRCVVQGVVDSGVCAILSKGWSDRGSRGKNDRPEAEAASADGADGITFPPEIFSVDAIDHSWLFPRIDAACHHGGAGTTGASLRAGIPTIIKPFFGDQYFWAERVESLGVGSALRRLTYDGLANALIEATTNERQIIKAKVVGQTIRKEEGVQRAIECIYRDLEYAKSIIKPPPMRHKQSMGSLGSLSLPHSHTHSHPQSRSSSPAEGAGTHSRSHSQSHLMHWRSHSHTGTGTQSETHSRAHSRTRSTDREGGPASDESWSVVSDSAAGSLVSSPRPDAAGMPHDDGDSSDGHVHHHRLSGIGTFVSHLMPHRHGTESPKS